MVENRSLCPHRAYILVCVVGVGRCRIKRYIQIVINAKKEKKKDKEVKGLRVDGAILNNLIGEISQKLSF